MTSILFFIIAQIACIIAMHRLISATLIETYYLNVNIKNTIYLKWHSNTLRYATLKNVLQSVCELIITS